MGTAFGRSRQDYSLLNCNPSPSEDSAYERLGSAPYASGVEEDVNVAEPVSISRKTADPVALGDTRHEQCAVGLVQGPC
jgi:hypothetical protein